MPDDQPALAGEVVTRVEPEQVPPARVVAVATALQCISVRRPTASIWRGADRVHICASSKEWTTCAAPVPRMAGIRRSTPGSRRHRRPRQTRPVARRPAGWRMAGHTRCRESCLRCAATPGRGLGHLWGQHQLPIHRQWWHSATSARAIGGAGAVRPLLLPPDPFTSTEHSRSVDVRQLIG